MHILLIEPDRILARTYVLTLERIGHTVAHATTAQGAIHAADVHTPDAVLLELQLANHNGVEFLYEFRSYPEWLRVPIILHTFVPMSELDHAVALQRELGIVKNLYKPTTSLQQLCASVQALDLTVHE